MKTYTAEQMGAIRSLADLQMEDGINRIHVIDEERNITMDERTMYELLEIYDAVTELEKFQEMLIGISVAVGPGEGILGNLSYVAEIILRHSPNLSATELETILEDKTLSNRKKARLLLTRRR